MITNTFRVPSWRFEKLTRAVDRLNDQIRKFEHPGWSLRVIDWESVTPPDDEGHPYMVAVIEVSGDPPEADGWAIVATLEWVEGSSANVVFADEDDPNWRAYRNTEPRCDVCNLARHRKRVIVVRNQDGQYALVGSSCIRKMFGFRGYTSFEAILDVTCGVFEECVKFDRQCQEGEVGSIPYGDCPTNTVKTIAWAVSEFWKLPVTHRRSRFLPSWIGDEVPDFFDFMEIDCAADLAALADSGLLQDGDLDWDFDNPTKDEGVMAEVDRVIEWARCEAIHPADITGHNAGVLLTAPEIPQRLAKTACKLVAEHLQRIEMEQVKGELERTVGDQMADYSCEMCYVICSLKNWQLPQNRSDSNDLVLTDHDGNILFVNPYEEEAPVELKVGERVQVEGRIRPLPSEIGEAAFRLSDAQVIQVDSRPGDLFFFLTEVLAILPMTYEFPPSGAIDDPCAVVVVDKRGGNFVIECNSGSLTKGQAVLVDGMGGGLVDIGGYVAKSMPRAGLRPLQLMYVYTGCDS